MNLYPYLPHVFSDVDPNVMLLSVGEFHENRHKEGCTVLLE